MVENDPPDELVSINEADQHVTTTQIEAIELEEIAIGAGETYLKRIEMFFPKDEEEEVNKNIKVKDKEKEKVKETKKKKKWKKNKRNKKYKNFKRLYRCNRCNGNCLKENIKKEKERSERAAVGIHCFQHRKHSNTFTKVVHTIKLFNFFACNRY